MFQILAALGRIGGVLEGVSGTLSTVSDTLLKAVEFGLFGAGGVTLKLSEKLFSGIENTPAFKKFGVNFGSKYMTPFGNTMYWNEIQKQIRMSNRQLGIAGQMGLNLEKSIINAGTASLQLGINEQDIVNTYQDFITEYGKTSIFPQEDFERMTKINFAFGQSFNKIFATNKMYGQSLESTYEFLNDLNSVVDRYGLNAKKVFNDIQNNIRLIDRFNFKNGEKGLANMVIQANKLGMEMAEISGFAEKIYNPEDAIDAAASLQMLGGEFAKLGDPLQLLYDANNDLEGLTEKLSQVTKGMASLNKESGQFELSSLEFRQLREFSKITGQSLESLAKQAKLMAAEDYIKQILPKDLVKYSNIDQYISKISSLSSFNNGVAKITVDGVEKLVSDLTKLDLDKLSQVSVTTDGDSFSGLIKSNQTLMDQMAIFSNEFTRAINKFGNVGDEIKILNEILLKGNESLRSGVLNNISKVINEGQKGSAESFNRVLSPILGGDWSKGSENLWENMDFKSAVNKGTFDALKNLMGGEDSAGAKTIDSFISIESTMHDGFTMFGEAVATFGGWVSKLTNTLSFPDFSAPPNEKIKSFSDRFNPENATEGWFGPAKDSYDFWTKSVPDFFSFKDQGGALKLFNDNVEAKKQIETQLTEISKSQLSINASNSTHRIEFAWNGEVYNVYDLFDDPKFREMLKKDMGESAANIMLSQFSNGGKNAIPLDTIPK